jgi:hypothetical protein
MPSKSAVESLRRKFRAAAYTKGGVSWRARFDFYDRNNRGVLEFADFARAVRKDGKVTKSALPERELRQIFAVVDTMGHGNISADEFEAFLGAGMAGSAVKPPRSSPRGELGGGWEGTATSESSYLGTEQSEVSLGESSGFTAPTDRTFTRSRVAQDLKDEEDAKCTFTPNVGGLPERMCALHFANRAPHLAPTSYTGGGSQTRTNPHGCVQQVRREGASGLVHGARTAVGEETRGAARGGAAEERGARDPGGLLSA